VLKIMLSDRIPEDHIAWALERSGIFSVRSAYKLAVDLERNMETQSGCSNRLDGTRPMNEDIWSANVPQKVHIFAWRLAQEGLATQLNRKQRTLEKSGRCQISGIEDESGYHAVVRCTKTAALRQEMRKHWLLPHEQKFQWSGLEWLLLLLSSVNNNTRARILRLMWRAWHLRNDNIHGKRLETVAGSADFITSYAKSLNIGSSMGREGPSIKGKEIVDEVIMAGTRTQRMEVES
jgi:hypothetical protein